MPFHRERYPDDWKAISKRIREERAGNKCEWCGIENGTQFANTTLDGNRVPFIDIAQMSRLDKVFLFGNEAPALSKIVLTVAHIDHDTTNNDDGNLAALCQRCHLRHDAKHHAKNAAVTRRRKFLERTGQTTFID
jgi:hypothetical protein